MQQPPPATLPPLIAPAPVVAPAPAITSNSTPTTYPVEIFEKNGDEWEQRQSDLRTYLATNSDAPCFVFAKFKSHKIAGTEPGRPEIRQALQTFYGLPTLIWTQSCWGAKSYYGCRDDKSRRHNTWFQFDFKGIPHGPYNPAQPCFTHEYHQPLCFTTWSRCGRKSIFCLSFPAQMIRGLKATLKAGDDDCNNILYDPYCFHQLIIQNVMQITDYCIWRETGDVLRILDWSLNSRLNAFTFKEYRQLKYNINEGVEMLNDIIVVLEKMMQRQSSRAEKIINAAPEERLAFTQVSDMLNFQHELAQVFKSKVATLCSDSENYSTWAFYAVTSMNSANGYINLQLTSFFLPAILISALFSTNFFYYDTLSNNWSLTKKFWIYWTVLVPTILITILFAFYKFRIMGRSRIWMNEMKVQKERLKALIRRS
ncbi:hypothetical protein TWF694_011644 [Orbilia ellipsospora]|uniref:Uncharacterized protein n=1 Tax=Orbilia ellipsospora TaxID=2528407 RepID=A0AAV9X5U9_9PEZI